MADDDKVIDKIRALLNKAENTNFGAEADAFVAKAHELMAKHSIEEAVIHAKTGKTEEIVIQRMRASKAGKAQMGRAGLLNAITRNSRCRTIISDDHLLIVGFKSDAEYVQMMYESLVVQMLGELYNARDEDGVKGVGVEYDMSFCDAYASRIFMRLEKVTHDVEEEVAPEGSSTALVLVGRREQVDGRVEQEFPHLKHAPMRRYNDGRARVKGDNAAKTGRHRAAWIEWKEGDRMTDELVITTNNVPRDVLDASELTLKEREDFDYIDWPAIEQGVASASFFRYKGEVYDLGEFMRTSELFAVFAGSSPLQKWDGYQSDTFSSGIVVRYVEDWERVIVGRYKG